MFNCLLIGNYKSLAEIVTGTLETDFDMSDRVVKLASGDEQKIEFAPVSWTEDKTIWKVGACYFFNLSIASVIIQLKISPFLNYYVL